MLYSRNALGMQRHVLILPSSALNTDPLVPMYEAVHSNTQPFILHLMALPSIVRERVFKSVVTKSRECMSMLFGIVPRVPNDCIDKLVG